MLIRSVNVVILRSPLRATTEKLNIRIPELIIIMLRLVCRQPPPEESSDAYTLCYRCNTPQSPAGDYGEAEYPDNGADYYCVTIGMPATSARRKLRCLYALLPL